MASWTLAEAGDTIGVWFDEAIPVRRSEKLMKRLILRAENRRGHAQRTELERPQIGANSKLLRKSNAPATQTKAMAHRTALADDGRDNNAIGSQQAIQVEVLS